MDDLNKAQLEAVTTVSGPLLVIAGAGSGKTRVLTRRVAYILTERLAVPYQILAVTFTNKAAQEMKERIAVLLGTELHDLQVSTFHSFCARFLRQEAEAFGYERSFTIFDTDDSLTLMKNCIKDLKISPEQFSPKSQLRKISMAKNKLVSAESFAAAASGYFESITAKIYTLYQQRLRECNAMDFDDLLFYTVSVLKGNEEIRARYRHRFQYLMVDEYQDTNHVQYLLLKYLTGEHQNLCVVGDEDQSIYGWRGADIRNILEFERDYPGAKIIKLERNYRSTDIILKAASAVIGNNEARKKKVLWTDQTGGEKIKWFLVDTAEDEAKYVIDEIEKNSFPLNEMVILYRTNAQSRPFEEQLRRRGIPYQIIGGITFYQRKEIKDLMAYLKLIVNPKDDVSFERIINYPKRSIGKKTLEEIAMLAHRERLSYYEVIQHADSYPELSGKQKKLAPFVSLIEKYRGQAETVPIDIFTQSLLQDINMVEDLLAEDAIIGQTRIENIQSFVEGMKEYAQKNPDGTLAQYLAEISLLTDIDSYEESEEKVTLMTLHSAKGLEYHLVFIVGLEEGLFPLQRSLTEPLELEEERRLFYVGATRARKVLYLTSAVTRHRFGYVSSTPSRFIKEIPADLVEKLDLRTTPSSLSGTRSSSSFSTKKTQPEGIYYEYESAESLRAGRIVQHPTFGRGQILRTEGSGEKLIVEILFSGLGTKKIMAKYGHLKVIG